MAIDAINPFLQQAAATNQYKQINPWQQGAKTPAVEKTPQTKYTPRTGQVGEVEQFTKELQGFNFDPSMSFMQTGKPLENGVASTAPNGNTGVAGTRLNVGAMDVYGDLNKYQIA